MRSWKHTGLLAACLTGWATVSGQTPAPATTPPPLKTTWTFLSQRKEAAKATEATQPKAAPAEPAKAVSPPVSPTVQPTTELPPLPGLIPPSTPPAATPAPAPAATPAPATLVPATPPSVPLAPVVSERTDATEQERSGQLVSRLRADELAARKRQADMRFLGTVDSRYWPEVQEVLLLSLRCDPSELVRLEAAQALGRGYSCSKGTLRALTICVNASEEDGHPAEASARVRAAARKALEHYVYHFERFVSKNIPLSPVGGDTKPHSKPTAGGPHMAALKSVPTAPIAVAYYKQVSTGEWDEVLRDARQVLALRKETPPATAREVGSFQVVKRLFPKTAERAATATTPVVAQKATWNWWPLSRPTASRKEGLPRSTEEPPLAAPLPQARAKTPTPITTVSATAIPDPLEPPTTPSREHLLTFFRTAKEAGFREWAAYQLGDLANAGDDAEVLRTLRAGAEQDADPLVRLACSRSLAKLQKGGS